MLAAEIVTDELRRNNGLFTGMRPLDILKQHNRLRVKNKTQQDLQQVPEQSSSKQEADIKYEEDEMFEALQHFDRLQLSMRASRSTLSNSDVIERQSIWLEKKENRLRDNQKQKNDLLSMEIRQPETHNSLMSWEYAKKKSAAEQQRLDELEKERDARRVYFTNILHL